ncbi:hypothetical protein [Vagococcus acidifermentans]
MDTDMDTVLITLIAQDMKKPDNVSTTRLPNTSGKLSKLKNVR